MLRVSAIDSQAILKVVDVWKNRQVYDDEFLSTLVTKIQPDDKCVQIVDAPQNCIKLSDLPQT